YGLACFYVVAGNQELALQKLAASFEKATPSTRAQLLATAQIDPDLEPLKNIQEYKDIITRYSN
ncbi:MAG: TPR end-of-group domain-containing protein, partial [Methylocella sp.]